MGRITRPVTTLMPQDALTLLAGENIAEKDLVQLNALSGKASPVGITDYAAVSTVDYGTAQTSLATGRIVAQTQVVNGSTQAYNRQAVLQDPTTKNIFTFTNYSVGTGLMLTSYTPNGTLAAQVTIAASGSYYNHHILQLSNGNIAVVANIGSTTALQYAIYDTNLNQIKALTATAEAPNNAYFSAVALSAGGFALVYQQASPNQLLSRFTTYDNTGTIVQAATTVWTRTGTSGTQYHRMVELSDGNLAIAVSSSNTVASIGLFHGVITPAGESVLAFTNIDTTNRNILPEISAFGGYYCVARANDTNQLAFVFNNAGTLQGAGFTAATASGGSDCRTKLLNDGTDFWLIWVRSTGTSEALTKLPVTGTGYATTTLTTNASFYNNYIDAFYENGFIIAVAQTNSGATSPYLWVINTTSGLLVGFSPTAFGVNAITTSGIYQRVISGGDGAFICLYDYTTTAATNLCVGKYANTSIIGVAQAAALANSLVPVYSEAGAYGCNTLAGSPAVAFDMSATANLYGNKGTLMNNGVVLKGM